MTSPAAMGLVWYDRAGQPRAYEPEPVLDIYNMDWGAWWRGKFKGRRERHSPLKGTECQCGLPACEAYKMGCKMIEDGDTRPENVIFDECESAYPILARNKEEATNRLIEWFKKNANRITYGIISAVFMLLAVLGLVGAVSAMTDWEPEPTPLGVYEIVS